MYVTVCQSMQRRLLVIYTQLLAKKKLTRIKDPEKKQRLVRGWGTVRILNASIRPEKFHIHLLGFYQ